MSEVIDLINFAIAVSGITVSVLGFILALSAQYTGRRVRRFFLCIFAILTVYTVSDLTSQISLVMLGPGFAGLSRAAVFLESFLSSLLMPLITAYMLNLCGEKLNCRLFCLVFSLWVIYVALLVVTQFTTLIYTITDDNVYRRGACYPILLIPVVSQMLINMAGLYRRRGSLTVSERRSFWSYLLIPAVFTLIQMNSYGVLSIVLGTSLAGLIMFVFILNDQADKSIRQAIEIGEQQLKIRSLQMRPQFIYNTMSNIYHLCETDPKKAQDVIGDFTIYLRNNFGAIVKQGLIPFEDEMEHACAYLAVVKARYGEHLMTKFDTPYTSFTMPPLTLEPIVENAVKHGLDPEAPPLYISIHTEQTEDGAMITVENSGSDISLQDTEPSVDDDNEPHIGLQNVSDRLKELCGGTLTLLPRESGGVTVEIRIPAAAR
ncbi:MAG: histidine kinase [Lachnospiraceae bacterium]|nr:histidine kinase [Lachnospiraceae bacterium]